MSDATQATTGAESGQGETGPKYVTEEQLNRAITARFGEFSKKQEKYFGDFMSKLDERFTALTPKAPEQGAEPAKSNETPESRAMAKRLSELEASLKAERDKAAAAEAKQKDQSLRGHVQDALMKSGIKDARVKHAMALLVDGEKRVRWDEDGERLVFRDDASGDIEFNAGMAAWLKSEDAKYYLPAPEVKAKQASSGLSAKGFDLSALAAGKVDNAQLDAAIAVLSGGTV